MPDMTKDDAETQKLRRGLHERIEKLPSSSLVAVDRLLLKIEVEQLRQDLDSSFDQHRAASKLSPQKVADAIALHRARHPYGG